MLFRLYLLYRVKNGFLLTHTFAEYVKSFSFVMLPSTVASTWNEDSQAQPLVL